MGGSFPWWLVEQEENASASAAQEVVGERLAFHPDTEGLDPVPVEGERADAQIHQGDRPVMAVGQIHVVVPVIDAEDERLTQSFSRDGLLQLLHLRSILLADFEAAACITPPAIFG